MCALLFMTAATLGCGKKIREELHMCAFINFVNFFLSVIGKTKTLLKTIIQKQDSGRLVWVGQMVARRF